MSKIEAYTEGGKLYHCQIEYGNSTIGGREECSIKCTCERLEMQITAMKSKHGSIIAASFTYLPFDLLMESDINANIVTNDILHFTDFGPEFSHPKHWAELDTMQIVMYFKLCKAVFEATKDSWENRGGDKIEAVGFEKVKESYPNYIDYEH